jgi:hypothetical protein
LIPCEANPITAGSHERLQRAIDAAAPVMIGSRARMPVITDPSVEILYVAANRD